jgi:hypothetical protein
MNYVGVDVHKKYSVLCALDEGGRKLREARAEGNAPSGFAQFFAGLDGPFVMPCCYALAILSPSHQGKAPAVDSNPS